MPSFRVCGMCNHSTMIDQHYTGPWTCEYCFFLTTPKPVIEPIDDGSEEVKDV